MRIAWIISSDANCFLILLQLEASFITFNVEAFIFFTNNLMFLTKKNTQPVNKAKAPAKKRPLGGISQSKLGW